MGENMTEDNTIIVFLCLMAAMLFAVVVLCFVTAAYHRQRQRASRFRETASLAIATAQKHEALMGEAVPMLRTFAQLAQKAGCEMDAARMSSIANSMQYAVGMATKLKEAIDG